MLAAAVVAQQELAMVLSADWQVAAAEMVAILRLAFQRMPVMD
jgi:hypothetical protein